MANRNSVTLTFAGDASSLEAASQRAGKAVEDAGQKMAGASRAMQDSGAGFDRAQEGFDTLDTRAMGFRDTVTGVQDSVAGFGRVLKGDFSADALVTAGMGVGDLASGFANFLVPQLKNAVIWLGNTRIGTLAVAGAQRLWNLAMTANPIGLVIAGIVLLVGAFILLWNKSEGFRNFWKGLWEGIKSIAGGVVDWFKGIPELFRSAFSGLFDILVWPYKTAFNFIADAWNNTVGKLSWTVPSWVPFVGGNTISAPKLPKFHNGGVVPGLPGSEMIAVLQAGERITPAGGGGGTSLVFKSDGRRASDLLLQLVAEALRGSGLRVVAG